MFLAFVLAASTWNPLLPDYQEVADGTHKSAKSMTFVALGKSVKPAMPKEFGPFLDRMEDGLKGAVAMQPLLDGKVPEIGPFAEGFPPQLALLHRDLYTLGKKGPWGTGKGVLAYETSQYSEYVMGTTVSKRIWIYDDQGRLRICAWISDAQGSGAFHFEWVWGFRWTDGPKPTVAAVFSVKFDEDEGMWTVRRYEPKAK